MPDIYVIVLDTYMRSDALKQDLGYDNSPFINQLTKMGFYVASCGHPNYTFTYASISALLNMRYIPGHMPMMSGVISPIMGFGAIC